MPLYDYTCEACEITKTMYLEVEERDLPRRCECGEKMGRDPNANIRINYNGPGWAGATKGA